MAIIAAHSRPIIVYEDTFRLSTSVWDAHWCQDLGDPPTAFENATAGGASTAFLSSGMTWEKSWESTVQPAGKRFLVLNLDLGEDVTANYHGMADHLCITGHNLTNWAPMGTPEGGPVASVELRGSNTRTSAPSANPMDDPGSWTSIGTDSTIDDQDTPYTTRIFDWSSGAQTRHRYWKVIFDVNTVGRIIRLANIGAGRALHLGEGMAQGFDDQDIRRKGETSESKTGAYLGSVLQRITQKINFRFGPAGIVRHHAFGDADAATGSTSYETPRSMAQDQPNIQHFLRTTWSSGAPFWIQVGNFSAYVWASSKDRSRAKLSAPMRRQWSLPLTAYAEGYNLPFFQE